MSFNDLLKNLSSESKPQLTTDPTTWDNETFTKWQVSEYNKSSREPKEGYNCTACNNRGYFALINYAGDFALRPCTCLNVTQQIKNANNSGFGDMLEHYTFEAFKDSEDWQKKMKNGAMLYTQQKELSWLYIGGMSGAGKSHICTAAAYKLLQQGKIVKLIHWRETFHKFESLRFAESGYNDLLTELENVEVLVIDDFLKGMDNSKQGSALEIAFEIVNRRYNKRKATIFSSEYQLGEIEKLDRALHGRIKERCGKFVMSIKNDENRNYRKRGEK